MTGFQPAFGLLAALAALGVSPASGATLLVPQTYSTIQAAVNASASGDDILIAPGIYHENVVVHSRTDLTIHSSAGAQATTIDGSYAAPVFDLLHDSGVTLQGLTITHGLTGVYSDYADGQVTIDGNIISRNSAAGDGGGIYAIRGSYAITQNQIVDNASNYALTLDGGGIYTYVTSGSIVGNRIERNTGHEGGGLIINQLTSPSLVVAGNLFANNLATLFGGGVYINNGTTPTVYGNTIVSNTANGNGGGVWYTDGSNSSVHHNVIALNSAPSGAGIEAYGPTGVIALSCNDVWNNAGGNYGGFLADQTGSNGNLSADPLFCGPATDDWTLNAGSPASAAGSGGCGLIGAYDVGCGPTAAAPTTWGAIKALYRK